MNYQNCLGVGNCGGGGDTDAAKKKRVVFFSKCGVEIWRLERQRLILEVKPIETAIVL